MTLLAQALETWRCSRCGRVLLEWSASGTGTMTLIHRKKCERCDEWNTYTCKVSGV